MPQFDIHLEIVADADWTIKDVKLALAEWAQEYELDMEGSIILRVGGKEVDLEYFAVD